MTSDVKLGSIINSQPVPTDLMGLQPNQSCLYKYKTYQDEFVWCMGTYRKKYFDADGQRWYEFEESYVGLVPYTVLCIYEIYLLDAPIAN